MGTPTGDLTIYYQHLGRAKVPGSVVIVSAPSTLALASMAASFSWLALAVKWKPSPMLGAKY